MAGTTDTNTMATAKTYSGFTYNNNTVGTVSSGIIAPDGSLVLKQYYSRNSYTLTFKPMNDGNDIVKTVKYGAGVSAPSVVKTGYTFIGWDKIVDENMMAKNTTYTAQWAVNNYSIEINTNGGNDISKITQAYGTVVIAPTIPTKPEFTFSRWYRDSNLTKPYVFSSMTAENITLYAKWNQNISTESSYKVEHYQQNESGDGYTLKDVENLTGTIGDVVTATAKNYEGFTLNSSVAETISFGTLAAGNSITLKLYYDRNIYSISFTIYEGTNVANITQKYGTTVTKPMDPMRIAFTFEGWYIDSNFTTPYTFDTMPAKDITLYAKWVPDGTYREYYIWVGGVRITTDNMTSVSGSAITGNISYDPTLNTLTLDNATISGYYSTAFAMYAINDEEESLPLTIKVIGQNTINMASDCPPYRQYGLLKSRNVLIIEGDSTASLTISGGTAPGIIAGISIDGALTVTGGVTVNSTSGTATQTDGFSTGIYDWNLYSTINVTNHSVLKLNGGSANTSEGYQNIYGGNTGEIIVSNGGQIIASGNSHALDGKLSGATQILTGQMLDGSDATIYSGSTNSGWSSSIKYVNAIAQ
jgi:uncharacterized repeat protein (TIGR02543 family)